MVKPTDLAPRARPATGKESVTMCSSASATFGRTTAGVLFSALLMVAASRPAGADVSYVEALKVKGAEGSTTITRSVHLSGLKEREESVMTFSPSEAKQTGTRRQETNTITRMDKGLRWMLDPGSKTYSQESLDTLEAEMGLKAMQADSMALTAEAPDADPHVTITPTSEVREIGPWKARKTAVEVSTEVVDLQSGAKRAGTIVWDLWLADGIPGAAEIRAFNRMKAQKLGTPSEIDPLEAIGKSFTRSVKQAMLALKEVQGYPVAWTWVLTTALSPEERAALAESAATQQEGLDEPTTSDDGANQPNNVLINGLRDVEQHTSRSNVNKDLHRPGEEEPTSGAEAASADMNADVGEGRMVLLKVESILKSVTTTSSDPSIFEVPSGYRNVNG